AAVQGRHLELTAQGRIDEADGDFAQEIGAITHEDRVLLHDHLHVKIPGRAAVYARFTLATQANAIAGVDTGRYFHGQGLVLLYRSSTVAHMAGILDGLA